MLTSTNFIIQHHTLNAQSLACITHATNTGAIQNRSSRQVPMKERSFHFINTLDQRKSLVPLPASCFTRGARYTYTHPETRPMPAQQN